MQNLNTINNQANQIKQCQEEMKTNNGMFAQDVQYQICSSLANLIWSKVTQLQQRRKKDNGWAI